MSGPFKAAVQFLPEEQGQEAAENVASDRLIPLMKDGAGVQSRLHVPEDLLNLPEFLVLEGHLLGRQRRVRLEDPLPVIPRLRFDLFLIDGNGILLQFQVLPVALVPDERFRIAFELLLEGIDDRLSLGKKEFIFIEAPMLHWPDSMMEYLTGDAVLFSNDAFGQHIASEHIFNDQVGQPELYAEAIKYYANILTPFSPLVTKKINEVVGFNLPLNAICPSHGVIWRDNPLQIVQQYLQWADSYQENQITIVYDTMWNGTRKLAEGIARGIAASDPDVTVKLFNIARSDKNDVITEIFKAKAVLLGSPTINRGFLSSLALLLEMAAGLKFRNKKAAAFGCYGWSGEAVQLMNEGLIKAGFEVVSPGLKTSWEPGDDELAKAHDFGASLPSLIKTGKEHS